MAQPIDLYSPTRYFFKVFFSDQSSSQLRIPTCFREHIEAECGRKITLKGPSGSIWKVSLVNNSNKLFFQDGWKEFVSDQSLDTGDLLVFRYNRNSGISVLVFDKTACEKEKAFTARRSGEECVAVRGSEMSSKQETPIFPMKMGFRRGRREIDDLLPSKVRKNKRQSQSESYGPELKKYNLRLRSKRAHVSCDSTTFATKKQKSHSESSFSGSSRSGLKQNVMKSEIIKKPKSKFQSSEVPRPGPQSNKKNTTKNPKEACKLISEIVPHERGDNNVSVLPIGHLKSQRRPVTEEEVSRTRQNALSFRSKNPFALLVMQDAYIYSGFSVNLPVWFVTRHLPKESTKLTIWDPNHKQWKITYIPYVRRGILSAGWAQFSYANNLEKHDVCIFELITKNHLQVHIFRVVDEITPLLRCRSKKKFS